MATLKFSIKAHSENPTKTVVEARNFKIVVDEPKNLGGTDDGPNPVEYVLAAFAGCLNVVGHLVAQEMGFSLKSMEISMEGDLDPAKFMGKETEERAGYKEIRVSLKPDSDADEETLQKWITSVKARCPVSDNLANATPVKVVLQ